MKELDFSTLVSEQEAVERYNAATHAMQSGVAMEMNYDSSNMTPKHLRVGVNSSLVDSAALAELLIYKKIITPQEYLNAIMLGMEREVGMYRDRLKQRFGVDIQLG